ncbi:hypothetical protein B0H11DRAFT_2264524 [Mycena galericulata]|nr:hypothetical protein B0H11DRAFT_2264524 [Mycena galericulata]
MSIVSSGLEVASEVDRGQHPHDVAQPRRTLCGDFDPVRGGGRALPHNWNVVQGMRPRKRKESAPRQTPPRSSMLQRVRWMSRWGAGAAFAVSGAEAADVAAGVALGAVDVAVDVAAGVAFPVGVVLGAVDSRWMSRWAQARCPQWRAQKASDVAASVVFRSGSGYWARWMSRWAQARCPQWRAQRPPMSQWAWARHSCGQTAGLPGGRDDLFFAVPPSTLSSPGVASSSPSSSPRVRFFFGVDFPPAPLPPLVFSAVCSSGSLTLRLRFCGADFPPASLTFTAAFPPSPPLRRRPILFRGNGSLRRLRLRRFRLLRGRLLRPLSRRRFILRFRGVGVGARVRRI